MFFGGLGRFPALPTLNVILNRRGFRCLFTCGVGCNLLIAISDIATSQAHLGLGVGIASLCLVVSDIEKRG